MFGFNTAKGNNEFTADEQTFVDSVEVRFSAVSTLGTFDDSEHLPCPDSMRLDMDMDSIDELASEYATLQGWAAGITGYNPEAPVIGKVEVL